MVNVSPSDTNRSSSDPIGSAGQYDWRSALIETMAAFANQKPDFGTNDCCQFVADYLERIGRDVPMPVYSGSRQAYKLLDGGGLRRLMVERLGEPVGGAPEPGDVVLVIANNGDDTFECPAIHNGSYAILFDPKDGVARADARIIARFVP